MDSELQKIEDYHTKSVQILSGQAAGNTKHNIYFRWFTDLWTEDLAQITKVKNRCKIVSDVQAKSYRDSKESKHSDGWKIEPEQWTVVEKRKELKVWGWQRQAGSWLSRQTHRLFVGEAVKKAVVS